MNTRSPGWPRVTAPSHEYLALRDERGAAVSAPPDDKNRQPLPYKAAAPDAINALSKWNKRRSRRTPERGWFGQQPIVRRRAT
jgi:hypothetical protein